MADGTTTECVVMDVSASGIAVSADLIPDIGTPVAVGKVVGRVVRHFNDGFAVQFAQLQDTGRAGKPDRTYSASGSIRRHLQSTRQSAPW